MYLSGLAAFTCLPACDGSWKGSRDGPIRANNIYNGEAYDARMEMVGWSTAAYDDSKWLSAIVVDEFAKFPYKISWQPMPPIREPRSASQ